MRVEYPRGICPFCTRVVPGRVERTGADGTRLLRLNRHRHVERTEGDRGRVQLTDHGWCGGPDAVMLVPHIDDLARLRTGSS